MVSSSTPKKEDKLVRLCAGVFRVEPCELNDSSGPGSVPSWESLGTMILLSAVEEEFGVRLPVTVAARIESIGELRQVLRSRGVADV